MIKKPTMSANSRLGSGIAQMFFSTFSFQMANVFVKHLGAMPVMEIVLFRSLVAGIVCWIGLRSAGVSVFGHNRKFLVYRGIVGTLALVFFFLTLQNIPFASATTIQYLSPIFTAAIGVFFLRESVRPIQWLFYLIAFSGVLIMKNFDPRISLGFLFLGILSALGSGIAYNLVRHLKESEHPLVVILYFQVIGVLAGIPASFLDWRTPSGSEWFYLILIGGFSYLGQHFLTNAFNRERAASVAIIIYSGLVYAITIGWFVYGEKQTLQTFLGMGMVVVGVIMSMLYGRRLARQARLAAEDFPQSIEPEAQG
ncbi:MAG: DMT family transporter [Pyrinomonadaceae bacterium]